MNSLKSHSISLLSISNMKGDDDILMKRLLLTHDPDGRWLDSETMLHAVGNIMFYASTTEVASNLCSASFPFPRNDITEIEMIGCPEPIGCIIREISYKMICKCSDDGDLNSRIMNLLDMISEYRWDAKVVLVLAAFAARYGEFWLLIQLHPYNTLAASLFRLKQLPYNLRPLKPRFKALTLLVKTMMDLALCIIEFESLPLHHAHKMGNEMIQVTKSLVYVAVYWITRSSVACFSQFLDIRINKHEQVYSDSTIIAAWELSSLAYRLSGIYNILRGQVDVCHKEIEKSLHDRLLNLVNEVDIVDNQKVLNLLFPSKNYLPFKDCSTRVKLGVFELKNKIVLLLISKPQLCTLEELLLLVQQTCDHPQNEEFKNRYKIVWVPLPSSDTWTNSEESTFSFLSDSLPWYAVWKPRLMSSSVVKYIREEWNYNEEPIIVVLDSNGKVMNSNALDMIMIWGARGYPFSALKEAELWQDQNLTMQLLMGDIDPLVAYWVEKGENICIYGSENLTWIQQFNDSITKLRREGLKLETVYVGNSHLNEHVKKIMSSSAEKNLNTPLSFTRVQMFWIRLESMRRSKLRLKEKTQSYDQVLAELATLLDMEDREQGWAVIGSGSSNDVIMLQGIKLKEFFERYHEWIEYVEKLGIFGAVRSFLDPTFVSRPCNHSFLVPSSEGLIQGSVICQMCKLPMKKFVVYQP